MSQTAREYLESEVRRLTEKARAVTRKAEDEGRLISSDEREEVEGIVKDVTELKGRLEEMDANEKLLDSIRNAGAIGNAEPTGKVAKARTAGDAVVETEAYKALKSTGFKGNWTTGPVEIPYGQHQGIGLKLTDDDGNVVFDTVGSTSGMFDSGDPTRLFPQVLPGIQAPIEQRLTVADLLGSGTATSSTIVYMFESLATNGADLTSEGELKPPSVLEFDKRSKAVEKIATFLPISDEAMEDAPQLVSYINGRLVIFVKQREEEYILDELDLATDSSAAEIGGDNLFDAIAAGIMHVREDAQLEPDGLLVTAHDAAVMDTAKAVAGDGNYFSGGPYGQPAANPWGLRRVITSAVADGAPVVGAFREGATLWRKGGLTVEASNSHADYFQRNLTAIRAEERIAVVQYRDAAFQVCSITS